MSNNQISSKKTVLILVGIMLSLLLSALDSTVVSTAMKTIVEKLGGMQYYAWPFTIYMLCSTMAISVSGGLADIYGHKRMFLIGIIAFLTGSILCGISGSMIQLIIFRGFQGIGGGMIVSGVFTVVADLFEPKKRGKYTGIVTSMYGLASIIGPLLGGFVTDNFGWKWIFFLNLPLGIAAIIMIAITMPNFKSDGQKKPVDYMGIAVLTLAVTPLLLDLSMAGKDFKWLSIPCIGMFVFSAIMLVLFIFVENKSSNPMIPPAFFKDRAISVSFLIAFFSQAIMFSAIMYLPYFIQGVIGSTATASGVVITPMMLGLLLASNVTGILVSKIGKARTFSAFAFILMIVGEALLSTMGVDTTYSEAIFYMVILGFGVGMSMPICNVNAQNAAPKQQIGSVTSTVMFFRNMGGTVGSAIFGMIMTSSLSTGFAGVDMKYLPAKVQELLKNSQIITNVQTVSAIRNQVPQKYMDYFDTIYAQVKGVLSNSVHNVFIFCIGISIIGFLVALILREAHIDRKSIDL